MPTYEMPVLFRVMSRPEIVTALKRVAAVIFSKGGFLRKIDNLGQQPIPYKMRSHGRIHREACYFILHFDVPPRSITDLQEEYMRDIDIVKNRVYKTEEDSGVSCTLHEELLPPAYRPDVQKLVSIAKRQQEKAALRPKFKFNNSLNYNPFQR